MGIEKRMEQVKETRKDFALTLCPYYSYEILNEPRSYLFRMARYKVASSMLPKDRNIDILELGCGEGIGSIFLAENGHRVTAIDIDEEYIKNAKKNINNDNIDFICEDFLSMEYGKFDAVISLGILHMLDKKDDERFFNTVTANLVKDGMLIISLPNKTASQYASKAGSITNVNMYTGELLYKRLREYFRHVFIFGMNDEVLHTGYYDMCHHFLAVALL